MYSGIVYNKALQESKRNNRLSCLALVLSVTAIVLVVLFVAAAGWIAVSASQSQSPNENASPSTSICIPCSMLLRDPSGLVSDDLLLRNLTIKVEDGKEICCASDTEQTSALFESLTKLREPPDIRVLPSHNVSDFQFSPVSAHKRLYPARIVRDFGIPVIPHEPPVCEFKPDDPRLGTEHHRGVDVLKRGLTIRHGGLYYIYASFQFRPQSLRPCMEFKYQTFTGYVEKISFYRPSGSTILLKASHTCCDTCINTQQGRFVGGVFTLDPGDVIRVKVMSFELVYFHPYATFAGLTMLGSPEMKSTMPENSDSEAA